MVEASVIKLQNWLERLKAGDLTARDELLNHSCERLRRLAHRMLQDFSRVRRWEDTDDVLQNALLRLVRALEAVPPNSANEFFRLAALQIRRELLDLARRYYGPQGLGRKQESNAGHGSEQALPYEEANTTLEPSRLAAWSEFHRRVEGLPDEERAVFELLWYQGLTRAEAAAVLDVSEPTVKRRWLAARLRLQDELPGADTGA